MGTIETHRAGLFAETLAALALRLCGWRILARRFRTPVGEIDIIARRRGVIAFVEVKRRPELAERTRAANRALPQSRP